MAWAALVKISGCLAIPFLDPVTLLSEHSLAKSSPIRKKYSRQLMKKACTYGASNSDAPVRLASLLSNLTKDQYNPLPYIFGSSDNIKTLPSGLHHWIFPRALFLLGASPEHETIPRLEWTRLKSNRINALSLKQRKVMLCH